MAGSKYTDDPTVSGLVGNEKFPITQSGADKNCTPSLMATFILSAITSNIDTLIRTKKVELTAVAPSISLNSDAFDVFIVNGLNTDPTFTIIGTPTDYKEIKLEVNAVSADRTLTFAGSILDTWGVTFPALAEDSKPLLLTFSYKTSLSKWILINKIQTP